MSALRDLFGNIYIALLFIYGVLLFTNYMSKKNQRFYFYSLSDQRMKNHRLNTKYNLNNKKRLNYYDINDTIFKFNMFALGASALIAFICALCNLSNNIVIIVSVATYFIFELIASIICNEKIGKKYNHTR